MIRSLGRGGMADVVEVHDTGQDRVIALKRLLPSLAASGSAPQLFELEYHTLSQLRHPSIVEVYGYGQAEGGPYYTMELLDGSPLRDLSPLPWRRVCELLVQVCSALSLVHSRRFVHRDITPTNIYVSADGRAKVLDFGAMAVAGPCAQVVGTPPCLAPEVFGMQNIDARTDLYALGATTYFALTGRNAYPARSAGDLRHRWGVRPPAPSELASDVPAALDALVMSMLCLDPVARPRSAAEVMQRVAAIAPVAPQEPVAAAQYLANPLLVGRDDVLALARKQVSKVGSGPGRAVLITSAPGGGRTRFLDACVLEAKLAGVNVLRGGQAVDPTPWGTAQALLVQLREVMGDSWPDACPGADRLVEAFPRLAGGDARSGTVAPEAAQSVLPRAELLELLAETFLQLARRHRLVIAVDDLDGIDEPSASLVALLSMRADVRGLWLIVTADQDVGEGAESLRTVSRLATTITLRPLDLDETRRMLGSVMGEVPHLDLLADRLHQASAGAPRAIMRLAQHLIDTRVVTWRQGVFVLPKALRLADLPADAQSAERLLSAELTPEARALAEVIALCPTRSVSLALVASLAQQQSGGPHLESLEVLQSAGLLRVDGQYCALADRDVKAALIGALTPEAERQRCRVLAATLGTQPEHFALATDYLVRARELDGALSVLLPNLDDEGATGHVGDALAARLSALPSGWIDTCCRLLEHCVAHGYGQRCAYRIRAHLFATALLLGESANEHAFPLLEQLARDSGLDLYADLGDGVPPGERLTRSLQLAQQRFDDADEQVRVLPPGEAVPLLARMTSRALASMTPAADVRPIRRLPDISPLAPLSPALELMRLNQYYVQKSVAGAEDEARDGYSQMVRRLEEPDGCGLDAHTQRYVRLSLLFSLARTSVVRECADCLEMADQLSQDPLFESHALTIRMCYARVVGQWAAAEDFRRELEVRAIRDAPQAMYATTALWLGVVSHMRCGDLLGLQGSLGLLEPLVARFPAWQPRLHLTRAVYERVRGDFDRACADLERGAALVSIGETSCWALIAAEYPRVLTLCGEPELAREQARSDLKRAQEAGYRWAQWPIRLALGMAELACGAHGTASAQIDLVIDGLGKAGATGVLLGEAHEARARIALAMGLEQDFATHAEECARYYRAGGSPSLTARHERLMEDGRGAAVGQQARCDSGALARAVSVVASCSEPGQRAERSLELLLRACESEAGCLYLLQGETPVLVAHHGVSRDPDADVLVRSFVSEELGRDAGATVTGGALQAEYAGGGLWHDGSGEPYAARLLTHMERGQVWVTGAALLPMRKVAAWGQVAHLLSQVSALLREAGDATGLVME